MRWRSSRPLQVLDLDTECRPLTYLGADFTTGDLTAIACGWHGDRKIHCWLLGETDQATMLRGFLELYEQADLVTAHNLRRHDLPVLNGALLEHGLPPLAAKLTCDTYGDLRKRSKISASQASLAHMLGVPAGKYEMTQPKWREANRLTAAGLRETRKRVVGDVRQHMLLRAALLERGWLRHPKVWAP